MKYTLNDITLPVFFVPVKPTPIVAPLCELCSKPISALHYHKGAELAVCVSGSGETHVGNRIYRYSEGCIQILPPYVPHLSCSDEGARSTWMYVSFEPQLIFKNAGLLTPADSFELSDAKNFLCGVFEADEYPALTSAIHAIIEQSHVSDSFSTVSEALAIASFLLASARTKVDPKDKSIPVAGSVEEKITPALEYIGNHLSDSQGLMEENLSKLCGISPATLRRLFIKHTGYPPKVFITRSRIAYAEYLLRKTELTVTAISGYVGYSEVSGFNRTFKQLCGVSPLKYRKG